MYDTKCNCAVCGNVFSAARCNSRICPDCRKFYNRANCMIADAALRYGVDVATAKNKLFEIVRLQLDDKCTFIQAFTRFFNLKILVAGRPRG